MEFITRAPTIDSDLSDPDGRSYENNPDDWHQTTSSDLMIRAVVEPYSTPVGGSSIVLTRQESLHLTWL